MPADYRSNTVIHRMKSPPDLNAAPPSHQSNGEGPRVDANTPCDQTAEPSSGRYTSRLQQRSRAVRREFYVVYLAVKDRRTPWYAKAVAACAIGYIISPIQFIPSFIPLIGFADDILVLSLGLGLLKRLTPRDVFGELHMHARLVETCRCEKIQTGASSVVAVLILAIWMLAAAASAALALHAARAAAAGWSGHGRAPAAEPGDSASGASSTSQGP